ncbi:hypothetical protein GCM10027294_43470 [Marinactinospora endophytica]
MTKSMIPIRAALMRGWRQDAACRDVTPEEMDLFTSTDPADQAEALNWCAVCPVRQQCLSDALAEVDRWSVRGGTTPADRGYDAAGRRIEHWARKVKAKAKAVAA